jgi:hypothetical protein
MPTWTGNGANELWSTVGNWDTAVPTAATTAVFNNTGGNSNKNVTITLGASCLSLTCTGYTGQMNFANALTVATNVTLGAGMTTSGSANIVKTGTGTLTSAGVQLSSGITTPAGAGTTQTFGDNWLMTGSFGINSGAVNIVGGNFTASIGGSLTAPGGFSFVTTPVLFRLTGTGTLSGTFTRTSATPTIEISSSGTIIQAVTSFAVVNFIYTTGSYNSTSTLSIGGSSAANTFDNVSSILFNSIAFLAAGGQSMTLNSNMYVGGALTGGGTAGAVNGAYTMYVGGNISTPGLTGTATIEMSGSSNATIGASNIIQNNLTINKSVSATVTFPAGSTVTWGTTGRTLTYTSGIINVSTSTFTVPASANVTINGMPFYNLTLPGASTTYTINSPISISNNLTINNTMTFTGSAGWTCANLLCSATNATLTLANSSSGASYRTTSTASLLGTDAQRIVMTSNNATTQSIWTLDNGALQSLVYINGTRIDSSQGQTIWSFGATLNGTTNWATGSRPGTVAYTFVN